MLKKTLKKTLTGKSTFFPSKHQLSMKSKTSKIEMTMKDIVAESYLLRRSYVSDDMDQTLDNLASHSSIEHQDYKFPSGQEHNGWVIPKKWSVKRAVIKYKNKIVYDGLKHPLGVITQSSSFSGTISLADLKKHLYYLEDRPKAIPFHFRLSYRPWLKEWGFCIPKNTFDKLKKGQYQVELETDHSDGEMVVREFTLPGKSSQTIIFVAHTDHPGQANDDLAGCAAGVKLMNHIKKSFKNRKYTYKLLLVQEIVGSVFYLKDLTRKKKSQLKYGLFLEMLGNDNILNLQESLVGDTYIDQVCKLALSNQKTRTRISGYRLSASNDEIAFEAPGFEIPMPSISRNPYDEYHSSDDNMEIIHQKKLQQSLDYLIDVVFILEHDFKVKRTFTGLVSLANPKYDLYIDPGQVITGGLNRGAPAVLFQYKMPRYLDGDNSLLDLSLKFDLDFRWLLEYFTKMKEKNLVKFI